MVAVREYARHRIRREPLIGVPREAVRDLLRSRIPGMFRGSTEHVFKVASCRIAAARGDGLPAEAHHHRG